MYAPGYASLNKRAGDDVARFGEVLPAFIVQRHNFRISKCASRLDAFGGRHR